MLSTLTWDTITMSKTARYQLKEETLTDGHMLYLRLYHSKEVETYTFNKIEEGVSGADWEWWFNDGHTWLGFRVQAKIINIKNDRFSHLHYKAPTKVPQAEILINQAETAPDPLIPIYCLYLATDSFDSKVIGTSPKELYGCSMLSAYKVQALRPAKINDVLSLQPHLKEWHHLVCGNTLMANLIQTAIGFLPNQQDDIQRYVRTSTPEHVRALQRTNGESRNIEGTPTDLAGIVVFNLPNPESQN